MSTVVIGWIVIVVNSALVVLNTYHMLRLRNERKRLRDQTEAVKSVGEDFTRRVMSGTVIATTDDGQVGVLVVQPEGDGLRLSVQPPTKDQVH